MIRRRKHPSKASRTRRVRKLEHIRLREFYRRSYRSALVEPGTGLYVPVWMVKHLPMKPGDWVCDGEHVREKLVVKFDPQNPEAESEYARSQGA